MAEAIVTLPSVGWDSASSRRIRVVLPAPVSPTTAVAVAAGKVYEKLSKTRGLSFSYLKETFSSFISHGASISMASPSFSSGISSSSISLSAAVSTATLLGMSLARLLAGPCIRLTSCRKAVIPPNVSVPAERRKALHANVNKYDMLNPRFTVRFDITENIVRRTMLSCSSCCELLSLETISLSLSSVFMTSMCCTMSCMTDCIWESESRTMRFSFLIFRT